MNNKEEMEVMDISSLKAVGAYHLDFHYVNCKKELYRKEGESTTQSREIPSDYTASDDVIYGEYMANVIPMDGCTITSYSAVYNGEKDLTSLCDMKLTAKGYLYFKFHPYSSWGVSYQLPTLITVTATPTSTSKFVIQTELDENISLSPVPDPAGQSLYSGTLTTATGYKFSDFHLYQNGEEISKCWRKVSDTEYSIAIDEMSGFSDGDIFKVKATSEKILDKYYVIEEVMGACTLSPVPASPMTSTYTGTIKADSGYHITDVVIKDNERNIVEGATEKISDTEYSLTLPKGIYYEWDNFYVYAYMERDIEPTQEGFTIECDFDEHLTMTPDYSGRHKTYKGVITADEGFCFASLNCYSSTGESHPNFFDRLNHYQCRFLPYERNDESYRIVARSKEYVPDPEDETPFPFINIYNPSNFDLEILSRQRYTGSGSDEVDIARYIIKLFRLMVDLPKQSPVSMRLGYKNTGIEVNPVTDYKLLLDCGTIDLPEKYQSALDYSPYCDFRLYLPFIGLVGSLDVDAYKANKMHLSYLINTITGDCVATLECIREDSVFHTSIFTGNASMKIPFVTEEYKTVNDDVNIEALALLEHTPYLVISYSEPFETPVKGSSFYGRLSDLAGKGYTEIEEIALVHNPANPSILNEDRENLIQLLKEGVVL